MLPNRFLLRALGQRPTTAAATEPAPSAVNDALVKRPVTAPVELAVLMARGRR